MKRATWIWMGLALLCLCGVAAAAEDTAPATVTLKPAPAPAPTPLTVAVLAFETKAKSDDPMGDQVADLLTVFLGADEGFRLVERAKIKQILQEMELGASGIVDPAQATRIGNVIGAQVIITGRAFVINDKLYLTGKAISTETSLVNAQLAKGALDKDLDPIVQELAGKLGEWLHKNAGQMVAKITTPLDKVMALRKVIGVKDLPMVAACVAETHVGQPVIDPAAETEVIYLMRKVGIPVLSAKELPLSNWAKEFMLDNKVMPPKGSEKADVIIVGAGLSEFAGRRDNLISVRARVELSAIDAKTGQILGITRNTMTVVDLSEQIAGKTALQKAAGEGMVELLPDAVKAWREARAKAAPADRQAGEKPAAEK